MTDTFGNPTQTVSDTFGNTVQEVPVTPATPAVVVTPAGAVVATPTTPVPNRHWEIDLEREIAAMKATPRPAYATESEELADLNGDIQRMQGMAGHNATARELVTFLEALVTKYTNYRQEWAADTVEAESPFSPLP